MKHGRLKSLIVILTLLSSLLGTERPAYACGPFARYAIFSYDKHPDFPLENFARGQLGVLQTDYARSYLYVAYRYMSGLNFNASEQQALVGLWKERFAYDWENRAEGDRTSWLAARKKVKGAGADPEISVYRETGKEQYDNFLNCPGAAFETAARTLEERIKQFGADSAEVKDWVQAQDKVFSNCAGGETIPEAAASSSPVIRADRAYQIASAKFYAMKFDEARADFERLASDTSSPWHETAQYMVARTLIRKASLGDEASRNETLSRAETQLKDTLAAIPQGALHDSAARLLNLVKLRLRPEERVRELAQSLMKPEPNPELKQELWDYTLLLDKYLGDTDEPPAEKDAKNAAAATADDLSDWLRTFQANTKESYEHALERWRKTQSRAWLVNALSKARGGVDSALIAAANGIEPNSPAYATASFHVVRLQLESGERAGARTRLDEILAQGQSSLPASALNRFLSQRMFLAATLEEFLKFAQRRPTAFSWDDDGREIPIESKDLNDDAELKQLAGRTLFDLDAAQVMNERLPLKLLQAAASSRTLPDHLRKRLALAAWTRAVMLNDVEIAQALAPVLAGLAPDMKPLLDEYASTTNPANKKAVGLYTLLKYPGTRPFVDSNVGRFTPLGQRDIYRDNWWCDRPPVQSDEGDEGSADESNAASSSATPKVETVQLDFLTAAQAADAKRESAQLLSLGTAPNYLAREAIAWAKSMPNNPRVPEALHIAVMATRYGCSDKDTGALSKAAWQLLHTRYKNTTWAKKTPYWFNN